MRREWWSNYLGGQIIYSRLCIKVVLSNDQIGLKMIMEMCGKCTKRNLWCVQSLPSTPCPPTSFLPALSSLLAACLELRA